MQAKITVLGGLPDAIMLCFDQISFCILFSDLVLKLKVVDPTYPALGVTVRWFTDTKTKLPDLNSTGDIISLHRVMVISRKLPNILYFISATHYNQVLVLHHLWHTVAHLFCSLPIW